MNRDEGQYQFTHILNEFLVSFGSRLPVWKQIGTLLLLQIVELPDVNTHLSLRVDKDGSSLLNARSK